VALVVFALSATPAQATDFNGGAISIPDSGTGAPYPSTVTVSGVDRAVAKVTVRIRLMHDFPQDIDAMLVGPRGQAVMLMSDVGSAPLTSSTSVTFDDAASASLPDPIVAGTYKPTNLDGGDADTFPAPAPAGPPGDALAAFKGTDPNGTWSLYVVDDEAGDMGAIASWTLSITNAPASLVTFEPAAYSVSENAGNAVVTVVRSASGLAGSVNYATERVPEPSAVAGRDYVAQSGTLSFAPGQTSATVSVPIIDDVSDGPDLLFRIHLSNAGGDATLSTGNIAIVTIADDDPPPLISIADVRIPEHSATGLGEFVVSLSAPSERLVTARLALAPGTATAGTDYNAVGTPAGFSFTPGSTSVKLAVRVRGDTLVEGDETFTATLSDVANATLGRAVATATIVDDDKPAPPALTARVSRHSGLEVVVTSNFDGVAVAKAQVSGGARTVHTASRRARVAAGRATKLTLHLPAALRHRRLTARVVVTVSSGATKETARRTFRLRA
jgi:large repetitive protein